jgi:hypothetical protein
MYQDVVAIRQEADRGDVLHFLQENAENQKETNKELSKMLMLVLQQTENGNKLKPDVISFVEALPSTIEKVESISEAPGFKNLEKQIETVSQGKYLQWAHI